MQVDGVALFDGDESGCQAFLRGKNVYYVYVLVRPNGLPFYVGKGKGYRILNHCNEARHPNNRLSNSHKLNVIRSITRSGGTVRYVIAGVFESELEAYKREEEMIRTYRRLHEGGTLTNRAPGGGSISGPSPFSTQKHSATLGGIPDDNPERSVLNAYVLAISKMDSILIKPIGQFIAKPTQVFPRVSRKPTLRQAVALAASAAANGIILCEACSLPRRVEVNGVTGLIENGVSSDIATSKMAEIVGASDPADECFRLSEQQARGVIGLVGARKCIDLGFVDEDWLKTRGASI